MNTEYTEYTVKLTSEPSYYGSECSQDTADRIVEQMKIGLDQSYPGIGIVIVGNDDNRCAQGPDSDVCNDIDQFIEDNWIWCLGET